MMETTAMTDGQHVSKTLVKGSSPATGDDRPQRARSWRWTLAAAAIGLVVIVMQGRVFPPPKPVILPPHIIMSYPNRWMPGRVSQLLELRSQLRLTPSQQKRLEALSAEERNATRPLNDRTRQDEQQFDRFVQSAKAHGGATLPAIQTQGQPVAINTRELVDLQQLYWNKAWVVLSRPQRMEVDRQLGVGHAPGAIRGTTIE